MSLDTYREVIRQAQELPDLLCIYPHCWGEPSLNPEIGEMIRLASDTAHMVSVATNAIAITPDMVNAFADCAVISVSMGGIDQESYEKYHQCNEFENALKGMRLLKKVASKGVRWTFVVLSINEHLLTQAEALAKVWGVRFRPKSAYLTRSTLHLLPQNETFRRYAPDGKAKKDRSICREFSKTLYVMADGTISVCCYDWGLLFPVGHIFQDSLVSVWNGTQYSLLRRIQNRGSLAGICQERCCDI